MYFQNSFPLLNFSFPPEGISVTVEAVLCRKGATSGGAATDSTEIQGLSKSNFPNNPKSARKNKQTTTNQKLKDHI